MLIFDEKNSFQISAPGLTSHRTATRGLTLSVGFLSNLSIQRDVTWPSTLTVKVVFQNWKS